MKENAVSAPAEQEQIRAKIGALFRGETRVSVECVLAQEARGMVCAAGTSDSVAARTTSTEPTFEDC
jgi:hypothetical protein